MNNLISSIMAQIKSNYSGILSKLVTSITLAGLIKLRSGFMRMRQHLRESNSRVFCKLVNELLIPFWTIIVHTKKNKL